MKDKKNKRILILSDPNSPHTVKWVKGLSQKGFNINLFGLTPYHKNMYAGLENVEVTSMNMKLSNTQVTGTRLTKLKYMSALPKLKKIISDYKPAILHAHYATSYGLLGALTGYHPLITSLWGSDVYDFPSKSFLYQNIFQFVLNRSDLLLSTSEAMKKEAAKYYKHEITVTPFGVDIKTFKKEKPHNIFKESDFVIGVAKNLEDVYGIDVLMKAFVILKSKNPGVSLKLLIIGSGTRELHLKKLANDLSIEEDTVFTGSIRNEKLPMYYSAMNVAVFLSRKESFGVSALEAMACERPVIATKVDGFKEILRENINGILVDQENPESVAAALQRIMDDKNFAEKMGFKGRERVEKNYNFEDSMKKMLSVYDKYLV